MNEITLLKQVYSGENLEDINSDIRFLLDYIISNKSIPKQDDIYKGEFEIRVIWKNIDDY